MALTWSANEPVGGSPPSAQQRAPPPDLAERRDGHGPDWTLDGVSTDERAAAGARLSEKAVQKAPEPLGRCGPGQRQGRHTPERSGSGGAEIGEVHG